MVDVPALTPPTVVVVAGPGSAVAIAVALLLQVPPDIVFDKEVVRPTHILVTPDIVADGAG
jgi:hypothetical protein